MKKLLIYFYTILFLSACASSKQGTPETSEALEQIISNNSFEIESYTAEPQTTFAMMQIANAGLLPVGSTVSRIDIIGTSNFLKIDNDSAEARLPFFGERQFGGGYDSRSVGIEFEGEPQDYQVKKDKKSGYEISFKIRDKNSRAENYNVNIHLFPNLTSTINIRSSHRFNIRYRGNIKPLEIE